VGGGDEKMTYLWTIPFYSVMMDTIKSQT